MLGISVDTVATRVLMIICFIVSFFLGIYIITLFYRFTQPITDTTDERAKVLKGFSVMILRYVIIAIILVFIVVTMVPDEESVNINDLTSDLKPRLDHEK